MGKFEKANRPQAQNAARRNTAQRNSAQRNAAQRDAARRSGSRPPQRRRKKSGSKLPVVLGILGCIVVVLACVVGYFLLRGSGTGDNKIAQNVYVAGVHLGGMTKEEAKAALQEVKFDENMNVRLYTLGDEFPTYVTSYDPNHVVITDIYGNPVENAQNTVALPTPEPVQTDPDAPRTEDGKPYLLDQTICLPASNVQLTLDIDAAVDEAYSYGRGFGKKAGDERVDIDISKQLSLNETYVREVLESTLEDNAVQGSETKIEDGTATVTDKDGNPKTVDAIQITLGTLTRNIDIDQLYQQILEGYMGGNYDLQCIYQEEYPEPVDLDKLYSDYKCVAPVNAVCDEETYDVTDGKLGYGFTMADAVLAFEKAKPGDTVTLTLQELVPNFTRETLQEQLFCDILASYDSPHTWNPTRTHNLELACEAINGYILKPGAVFSFNDVVGERTAEKGYGEAGVYVGGKTENQLGGGVCQVASTIFWCTLKSDLEIVERAEHQFLPGYIPYGMDATVYFGYLDYRFRNNTAYPIRIDASVSDGYVHVRFVGTDTKDYTVELDYKVTAWFPHGEKIIDISPDMPNYNDYKNYGEGDVIQTAYDGANVTTYVYKYDKDHNLISTDIACYSNYDSRDREIAHIVTEEPTESSSEETSESSSEEPTESSSEETSESSSEEPTESSSEESEEP